MLTRRDFLQRVLGAAALAAVPAPLLEAVRSEAAEAERWRDVYAYTLVEGWRRLRCELAAREWRYALDPCVLPQRLGDRTPSGVQMAHQFNVELRPHPRENELDAAMHVLANALEAAGVDHLAHFERPRGGLFNYADEAGPLRLIVAVVPNYHGAPTDGLFRTAARFDLIGGTTPEGLRRAERRRQARLATHIKTRLARSRRVLPLPA